MFTGVDVGGSEIKALLVDRAGVVSARYRGPTPPAGPRVAERVVEAVARAVAELGDDRATPVGVVVPGLVDEATGVAVSSTNLGWRDVPMAQLAERALGRPVAFGHDVRAGALAELRFGALSGRSGAVDAAFVPIGTGVAAALVLGGRLHAAGGLAGEIGHVDVGHGEPCVCGHTGCLEAVASAAAIARRYEARTGRPAGSGQVARLVAAGDPEAVAVWDDAIAGLVIALRWLAAVVAPEVIVIGGGLAQAGPVLLDPLQARLDAALTYQRRPRLVPARLGADAGALGAALLAADLAADLGADPSADAAADLAADWVAGVAADPGADVAGDPPTDPRADQAAAPGADVAGDPAAGGPACR